MSTIKSPIVEVNKENPFENCKLDRKKYAEILTSIVDTYGNGFVLGLDGAWGTGKTTFLKMWEQYLLNDEYNCVYINAWKNDYVSDPMAMILGSFYSQLIKPVEGTKEVIKSGFDTLLTILGRLAKSGIPVLAKSLAKKKFGEDIAELFEAVSEEATNVLVDEIKSYEEKQQSFDDFKDQLQKVVNKITQNKPIVVLVDELDRCNPHFAVKVLERIKHFFDIDRVVFVLGVDATQLSHSIRGYYGSESIQAEEYLKRFIDLWYYLPEPDYKAYCDFLYETYGFSKYFENKKRMNTSEGRIEKEEMEGFSVILAQSNNLSLRQIEKLYIRTKVALNSFNTNSFVFPGVFMLLSQYRDYNPELYKRIKNGTIDFTELSNLFEDMIIDDEYMKLNKSRAYHVYAIFMLLYEKHLEKFGKSFSDKNKTFSLFLSNQFDIEGKRELAFQLNKFDANKVVRIIESYEVNYGLDLTIQYIMDKLELLDQFVSE